MLKAHPREFHSPDGWELEADVGYHEVDSCPGDWWEPAVHVFYPCEDADVIGCIGSLKVVEV